MKRIILFIGLILVIALGTAFFVEAEPNNIGNNDVEFLEIENNFLIDKSGYNSKIFDKQVEENIPDVINVVEENAQQIPVLNYHFFYSEEDENCNEIFCLDINSFKEQLDYLKYNGYKTLTIQEFRDWMYGKIELPKKSVLLTIDDGAMGTGINNGNKLIPILEEYGMNATLFLITTWWDVNNYQSDYLAVESHGDDIHRFGACNANNIQCLSHQELIADINKSIQHLNSKIAFAYPFNDYTEDSLYALEELGFEIAFIGSDRKATRNDHKYLIPRYAIYDFTSMDEFINMVN